MRNLTTIAVNAVAQSTLLGLETAHQHAADFHQAMHDAIAAQKDLEGFAELKYDADDDDVALTEKRYQDALGRAAVALQKMPILWASILNHSIDAGCSKATTPAK